MNYAERSWLEPPALSLKKEALLNELDTFESRKKALENLPYEWTTQQENEYNDLCEEIRLLQIEIKETP